MNPIKPLALESDVFDFILERIAESGESASTFLRHRLGLTTSKALNVPLARPAAPRCSELDALLSSVKFRHAKGVVGRFLVLLGWLHEKHGPYFDKVENIKGRGRLYFARSEQALNDAGKNVNPKQIPNSPFWVITTSPTDLKQQMIRAVMLAFGYRTDEVRGAAAAIAGAANYHLELWHVDGTILGERAGVQAFPEWRQGDLVRPEMLNKPVEVREILDSSHEENGTVYFRRIVRVADLTSTQA